MAKKKKKKKNKNISSGATFSHYPPIIINGFSVWCVLGVNIVGDQKY